MATSDSRFFPYERPYENQGEAISKIRDALAGQRDVLFEGACGTGKTLSALVPALEFAREHDKTVLITTSVHQQTRQFIEEARRINGSESLRTVVFKGKAAMCHIDVGYEECQVLRDRTKELVDLETERNELETAASDLLERSKAGNDEATDARASVMNDLDGVEEEITEFDEGTTCEHYYNNLTENTDEFYAWLDAGVRTPEEVYAYAEREGFCGYELLKDGLEGVDLAICNYHHLLDPPIREQFFRWLGRDPSDVITVFDEAHNIEATAREHATRTLTETTLESALDELDGADGADTAENAVSTSGGTNADPRAGPAGNVIGAFYRALCGTYDDALGFGARERIGEDWEDLAIANATRRDDLTLSFLERYSGRGIDEDLDAAIEFGESLDEEYERAYRDGEATVRAESQTLQAARFIETWLASTDGGHHPVLSVRRGPDGIYGRAERYACLPRELTSDLFESTHANVLMSATLRPFDVLADVLGLEEPETMSYELTFPEERRRTFAVRTPALFASQREDRGTRSTVGSTITDAIRMTPGNTLVFFPSYAEAERYHDRISDTIGATCYLDRAGIDVEERRQKFVAGEDGALFTSLWGTLTEGVSFDGEQASTVLVVGVPYPHLDDRLEAVEDAYEDAFGEGWEYAIEVPTVRKTRQALGRVLRSPEEIGVRALLDERYCTDAEYEMGKYAVHGTFPPEEREEFIDIDPRKLKYAMGNFFADYDAYGGSPPEP